MDPQKNIIMILAKRFDDEELAKFCHTHTHTHTHGRIPYEWINVI